MKQEFLTIPLFKNEQLNRFEIQVDGHIAFIDYQEEKPVIKLVHTESPEELSGRGVATALIEKILQYLEEHNYQLVPICPFVLAYVRRNPEWKRIVSADFKGFDNL